MMETYKKQIDDSSVESRETCSVCVTNKVVNQTSDREDNVCDDRNFQKSTVTNWRDDKKIASSKSSVRFGYRKTPLAHKSHNKRSRAVVKIAKLLAKQNSSSNEEDDEGLTDMKFSALIKKRTKSGDYIECPHLIHPVIHHHRIQSKHSALSEVAKCVVNMLKRTLNESETDKAVQIHTTKTLRRRSLCDECSTMNQIVRARFDASFVNSCATKCNGENGTKICLPPVTVGSSKGDREKKIVGPPISLEIPFITNIDHYSAFSAYSKDSVDKDPNDVGKATETTSIPKVSSQISIAAEYTSDGNVAEIGSIWPKKRQLPVVIINQKALNSVLSAIPDYKSLVKEVTGEISLKKSNTSRDLTDENQYFIYKVDESSRLDDLASSDKEVAVLTKSKRRKQEKKNVGTQRFVEPVAWTLTFGNDKFFVPVTEC